MIFLCIFLQRKKHDHFFLVSSIRHARKKYKNFGKKPSKSNKDVNDEFVLKKIVLFEINK